MIDELNLMQGRSRKQIMRRSRRGFSIVEMTTVIAIVGLAVATTTPYLSSMTNRAKLRKVARNIKGALSQARTAARSGREGMTGWSEDARVKQSGLRLENPQMLHVFVDSDENATNNNEAVLLSYELDSHLTVSMNAEELRFKRNGTLVGQSDVQITVRDTRLQESYLVSVTYGGQAKMSFVPNSP